jgi:hypothetical protein
LGALGRHPASIARCAPRSPGLPSQGRC